MAINYTKSEVKVIELCNKAKITGYIGLTAEEKNQVKPFITQLVWKKEAYSNGPVYVDTKLIEKGFMGRMQPVSFNYQNGDTQKNDDDDEDKEYYAKWVDIKIAQKLAKLLNVPLREI